jgi:prepilin signal peptidase PulO-like enzyme (type II secretory pathway)
MIYFILIILGLCFGSFINALVWRIHIQMEQENRSSKVNNKTHKDKKTLVTNSRLQTTNYSVLNGRSMCPNCHHTLSAKDLIPVFSWIGLGGKCRYCKKPIHWQYPLIELLMLLLFVLSYIFWPTSIINVWQYIAFATWLLALVSLVAMAVYDAKYMIIPDRILLPTIIFVVLSYIMQFLFSKPLNQLWPLILASAIGCGFFATIYVVSKGKWIGFGDVKLSVLLGLLATTPINMLIILFLASILGTIYSLPLMLTKKLKHNSHVPFGPFLIAATIITVLFGQYIIDFYKALLII